MDDFPDGLLHFWRCHSPPGLHKADESLIASGKCVDWDLDEARRQLKVPDDLRALIHQNLIAHPYLGSPNRAMVYILYGNPGCEPTDYEDELANAPYSKACRRLLHGEEHGFLPFHKSAVGTGAWRYWRRVFRRLAADLGMLNAPYASRQDCLESGYEIIRTSASVLEAVPYHSRKEPGEWAQLLPSARQIYSHVHKELLPRSERLEVLLIVWRKARFWDLQDGPNRIVRSAKQAIIPYLLTRERIAIRDFIQSRSIAE